jgi:nicotinate-nucleotide adenylyltransferase
MGGSFNPAHDGHRIVAETAIKRIGLDQLWWLVTPGNPLKANNGLPPLNGRMAQIAAFATGPRMKVTGFEQALGTPYTAATLGFLIRRYPDVHFIWVMGADNLASFDRWQHWRDIARTLPLVVVDRPGWRHKALAGPAASALAKHRVAERFARALPLRPAPAWTFLTSRLSDLSSTQLRAATTR